MNDKIILISTNADLFHLPPPNVSNLQCGAVLSG